MCKLIFLIFIIFFVVYVGWVECCLVGYYLFDLCSQVSVVQGQFGEYGNLLVVQLELFMLDYQSVEWL